MLDLSISGATAPAASQVSRSAAGTGATDGQSAPPSLFGSFVDALSGGTSEPQSGSDDVLNAPSSGAPNFRGLAGKAANDHSAQALLLSAALPKVPSTTVQPDATAGWAVSPRRQKSGDDEPEGQTPRRTHDAGTPANAQTDPAATLGDSLPPDAFVGGWWGGAPTGTPNPLNAGGSGTSHQSSSRNQSADAQAALGGMNDPTRPNGLSTGTGTLRTFRQADGTGTSQGGTGTGAGAANADANSVGTSANSGTGEQGGKPPHRFSPPVATNGLGSADAAHQTTAAAGQETAQETSTKRSATPNDSASAALQPDGAQANGKGGLPVPTTPPIAQSVPTTPPIVPQMNATAGTSTATAPTVTAASPVVPVGLSSESANDIVQTIQLQATAGGGSAEIRLEPQFLGDVTISVRVDQGQVSARLEADAPVVREWLQTNQGWLRDRLADQNLTLSRLEIATPAASDSRGSADRRDAPPQQPSADDQPRRQSQTPPETGEQFEVLA